jgi:transposase
VKHGLCNAHHLRELTYIHGQEKEAWALKMKELLLKAKKVVAMADGQELSSETIKTIKTDYAKIVLVSLQFIIQVAPQARPG